MLIGTEMMSNRCSELFLDFILSFIQPDLASSNYYVFWSPEGCFKKDDMVKETMHSWLKAQPKCFSFFIVGLNELVQQCELCFKKSLCF